MSEIKTKERKKNVKVETGLQNVYIISTSDFHDRKKITENIPLKTVDENEWLKTPVPSEEEQILSYSGQYCYLYPVWGSDSKNIFAMKRIISPLKSGKDEIRLIKIRLNSGNLTGKEVVKGYLKGILSNDRDYVHSLSETILKNPISGGFNLTGFSLIKEGKENKKPYVDAEILYGKPEGIEYLYLTIRFYLGKQDGRLLIKRVKAMNKTEIKTEGSTITLSENHIESSIYSISDIPKTYLEGKKDEFTAAAYVKGRKLLFFLLQDREKKDSIQIFCYDRKSAELSQLGQIRYSGAVVTPDKLLINKKGTSAALEYTIKDGKISRNNTVIINTGNRKIINLSSISKEVKPDNVHLSSVDGNTFYFSESMADNTMWFQYNTEKLKILAIQ